MSVFQSPVVDRGGAIGIGATRSVGNEYHVAITGVGDLRELLTADIKRRTIFSGEKNKPQRLVSRRPVQSPAASKLEHFENRPQNTKRNHWVENSFLRDCSAITDNIAQKKLYSDHVPVTLFKYIPPF